LPAQHQMPHTRSLQWTPPPLPPSAFRRPPSPSRHSSFLCVYCEAFTLSLGKVLRISTVPTMMTKAQSQVWAPTVPKVVDLSKGALLTEHGVEKSAFEAFFSKIESTSYCGYKWNLVNKNVFIVDTVNMPHEKASRAFERVMERSRCWMIFISVDVAFSRIQLPVILIGNQTAHIFPDNVKVRWVVMTKRHRIPQWFLRLLQLRPTTMCLIKLTSILDQKLQFRLLSCCSSVPRTMALIVCKR
jgi:hypothetical protein